MKNFCLNLTVDQGDWQILGNIRCYMVLPFISIHGIAAKGIWIHQMGLDMARLVWTRGLELLCGPWWCRASSRLWAPRFTGVAHGFCRKMGKEMEKKINANFKFGVAQCHEFVVCCLLFWKKIIKMLNITSDHKLWHFSRSRFEHRFHRCSTPGSFAVESCKAEPMPWQRNGWVVICMASSYPAIIQLSNHWVM